MFSQLSSQEKTVIACLREMPVKVRARSIRQLKRASVKGAHRRRDPRTVQP